MNWSKPELYEMLRSDIVEITFTKIDGSSRVMKCSLQDKYLPVMMEDTETATKDNPNVLAVWDIDNNGWRSFRINSITEVRIVND
jgi:hypothetical protein